MDIPTPGPTYPVTLDPMTGLPTPEPTYPVTLDPMTGLPTPGPTYPVTFAPMTSLPTQEPTYPVTFAPTTPEPTYPTTFAPMTGLPTLEPTYQVTPETGTPPTEEPIHDMDPTLYAITHRDTYLDTKKVHALTVRAGTISLEPFNKGDLSQTFLMSSSGRIRSASGNGVYIESDEGCLVPILRNEPSENGWTVSPAGEESTYYIVSACGASLHAEPGSSNVDLARQTTGSQWYIMPIGHTTR